MRKRSLAFLTPDPEGEAHAMRWRQVLSRTAAPLESAGFEIICRPWTDAGDLAACDHVLPLFVWGYHQAGNRWLAALDAWEAAGVKLRNSTSIVRWNGDKIYLQRLAEAGAPVVPTRYRSRIDEQALTDAAVHFATDQLVAKPRISAGAWQTIVWTPGERPDDGPSGAGLIQPFLPAIRTDGEISLIFFGGRFSHAIRKQPRAGDFRVQPEFDGHITRHTPSADELVAAERVLRAIGEPFSTPASTLSATRRVSRSSWRRNWSSRISISNMTRAAAPGLPRLWPPFQTERGGAARNPTDRPALLHRNKFGRAEHG